MVDQQKLREDWLKALRSGEYEQTTGVLHDGLGYCCLGVLTHVYLSHVEEDSEEYREAKESLVDEDAELKALVSAGCGLRCVCGGSKSGQDVLGHYSLAEANDDGKSFAEIADFIEQNPDKAFVNSKEST